MNGEQERLPTREELVQMERDLNAELQRLQEENPVHPDYYPEPVAARIGQIVESLRWIKGQFTRFK